MPQKKKNTSEGPKKKKPQPSIKVLNLQSMLLREAKKLALLVFVCGLPVYVYVITVPQQRKLHALERKLKDAEAAEYLALEANDRITREISAYRSNPEYLEIIARDHLNYYKEGETVIRIER